MAENLNFDPQKGNSWCYDGEDSKCKEYGRLYDWATAMNINTAFNSASWNGSDVKHQGVCPMGWHLPSRQEWEDLIIAVGGTSGAGKKLKSKIGWNSGTSTDDYGFSALPGGVRRPEGSFDGAGLFGDWWAATDGYDGSNTYFRNMDYNGDGVLEDYYVKSLGLSVRCVKND